MSSFHLDQHPALRRQASSKGGSSCNTNLPIKDINIEVLPAPPSQIMSSNTTTTTDTTDGSLQLTNDELQLTSSRTLSSNEKAHLRSIFEEQLTITSNSNSDDIDDAIDLIDYGIDMVDRGKNVESVMQEVSRMIDLYFIAIVTIRLFLICTAIRCPSSYNLITAPPLSPLFSIHIYKNIAI